MTTTLTIDLFISADGWAGSEDLPGYFGYLGPELEAWIEEESAAPQVASMGRKTYQLLSGLPDEDKDEGHEQMTQRETVVFSRTLSTLEWPNARLCSNDAVQRRDASNKSRTCRSGPWAACHSASNSWALASSTGCAS